MTKQMAFLLADGFSLLSYASAVEPLRAANTISGRSLYRWSTLTVGDVAIRASSGLEIGPDIATGALSFDTIFVCIAGNPAAFDDPGTFAWLRRQARQGVRLAGVSGGPFVLARAGLLDGYRCTVHWEHASGFETAFPQLDLRRTLYEIDRKRMTCGGGVAALDLMHELIALDHGPALAGAVSDWFLHTEIRLGEGAQRPSPRERHGTVNPKLLRVLGLMEASPDEPPSRMALARAAGVSLRQLERLFSTHMGSSIAREGQRIRLDHARRMVRQTDLPILEIALACGFTSASHFSRRYTLRFGHSPRVDRNSR